VNEDGSGIAVLATIPSGPKNLSWSPDGKKLAFDAYQNADKRQIFTVNADGSGLAQLTRHMSNNIAPRWSPSGDVMAFASDRDGTMQYYVMNLDGSSMRKLTSDHKSGHIRMAWSPDGHRLALVSDRETPPGNELRHHLYIVDTRAIPQGAPGVNGNMVNLTKDVALNDCMNGGLWIEDLAWSPRGDQIALSLNCGDINIYLLDVSAGVQRSRQPNITNLTKNKVKVGRYGMDWSPDATKIAFTAEANEQSGATGIFLIDIPKTFQSGQPHIDRLVPKTESVTSYSWPVWRPDSGPRAILTATATMTASALAK
jgi:TolB protein